MADETRARGDAGSSRSGDAARRISPDLYALLGVASDASPDELRAAYRALMKRVHPDRSGDRDAAAAAALNHAMQVLGDPRSRRAYDRSLRPPASAEPRIYPLVVIPTRRGVRPHAALAIIAVAVALVALVAWLAPAPPPRFAAAAPVSEADEPVVDRTLLQTVTQQASLDLEWVVLYGGVAGAERFSRNCFAELNRASSLPLLLFCTAIDARGALLFSRRAAYFGRPQRQSRFGRAAALLSQPVGGLWRRVEAQSRALHEGLPLPGSNRASQASLDATTPAPLDVTVEP